MMAKYKILTRKIGKLKESDYFELDGVFTEDEAYYKIDKMEDIDQQTHDKHTYEYKLRKVI
jgi:hypothetical protein